MQMIFLTKKFFFNLIFLFFFLLISNVSSSEENFIIQGNENISKNTILSLKPENFSISDKLSINNFQKILYKSGFFENINIVIEGKNIYIKVKENPLVNFFFIDGIAQPELNKKISKIPEISENTFFQNYLIKKDLDNISLYLRSIGYLKNKVSYEIIKLNSNKINIFYNIELNNKFRINRIYFIGNKIFNSSTLSDIVFSS